MSTSLDIAQSVKCQHCKHKDPSSMSRTHFKKKKKKRLAQWCCAWNPTAGNRESPGGFWIVSLAFLMIPRPAKYTKNVCGQCLRLNNT